MNTVKYLRISIGISLTYQYRSNISFMCGVNRTFTKTKELLIFSEDIDIIFITSTRIFIIPLLLLNVILHFKWFLL